MYTPSTLTVGIHNHSCRSLRQPAKYPSYAACASPHVSGEVRGHPGGELHRQGREHCSALCCLQRVQSKSSSLPLSLPLSLPPLSPSLPPSLSLLPCLAFSIRSVPFSLFFPFSIPSSSLPPSLFCHQSCVEVLCASPEVDIGLRDRWNRTAFDISTEDCKELLQTKGPSLRTNIQI